MASMNWNKNPDPKRKKDQGPQTVIIPQITPEILAKARKAAEQPTEPKPAQTAEQPAPKPEEKPARKTLAQAQNELYQNIHDDHLWLNNPVMVRGLGLAPLVVVANDGENALMLCVATLLMLTATRVLAVAVCHLTGNRFRPMVYAYSAALVYIPTYLILYELFGTSLATLGIYLPLLVVEPAIIKRMEAPELETLGEALRRGLNNTVGICVAVMLVGCLRELLAYGTLFDRTVLRYTLLPLASQPAGGFLLAGLIAAAWVAVGSSYVHYKREEVQNLYGKRKR